MDPVVQVLFPAMMILVVIWLTSVVAFVRRMKARHPSWYDDMGLEDMWPRTLDGWFGGHTGAGATTAMLRFLLHRTDRHLNDAVLMRICRRMRWTAGTFLAVFALLVGHHLSGYGSDNRGALESPAPEATAPAPAATAPVPASADVQRRRAAVLHRARQYAEALAIYDALIAEGVVDSELLHQRGQARMQLGRYDAALEDFRAVVEDEPFRFGALEAIDWLESRRGNWDAVVTLWDVYLINRPDDAQAIFKRAEARARRGDDELAVGDAERACALGETRACEWLAEHRATPVR